MTGEKHPYVQLAHRTILEFVRAGKRPAPPRELVSAGQAGVFVSLKTGGRLRGCIGTINPVHENLAEEIIENAVSAATRDPRFAPVSPEELDSLDVSVDVLTPPEPVADRSDLDAARFGVIVKSRGLTGVLLPDLAGVDTVDEQLDIARKKAGIGPDENFEIYRFEVKRFR